jgi:hypothetical protein
MTLKIGDLIIYADKERQGECIKGEIVDIWTNNGNEITDYFVVLDSGQYITVKPHYPNWCRLDTRFLNLAKNGLSFSFLSPRCALVVDA